MYYPDPFTSFIKIHEINKRALPENLLIYKHAIQLHKLYNSKSITNEWLHLNTNQVLTSRQTTFITHKTNTNKVGLNALANRLYILNGKIPLGWLNLSVNSFKTKCKIEILKLWSQLTMSFLCSYHQIQSFCLHTGYSKPRPFRGLTSCLSYLQPEANGEQTWL